MASFDSILSDTLPLGIRAAARLPKGLLKEIRHAAALAKAFNEEVVRPQALAVDHRIMDEPDFLPHQLVREANERGFYSLWLPKAFGGGGYSALSMLAFSQELATECLGIGNLIGSHYVGVALVSATFNFTVLRRLCADIVAGEKNGTPCLVSTAITEPDAGTDMEDVDLIDRGHVQCRAEKAAGGYRLTGSKIFISNGHLSSWHIVTGYTDLARPSESSVILAVKTGSPGFSLGRIERKLGQNACPASVLNFDQCFVPASCVCLEPGPAVAGASHRDLCAMLVDDVLAMSRPGVAIMAAGAARGAYREALRHCLRPQPGVTLLANHEWAQSLLAEMQKNIKLSEYCAWEAGLHMALDGPFRMLNGRFVFWLLKLLPVSVAKLFFGALMAHPSGRLNMVKDRLKLKHEGRDRSYSALGSLAKFSASDLAIENCRIALRLMGQSGFRSENRVEKILRDVKLLQIYEGTNQLNRLNLFKQVIGHGVSGVSVFNE
ncbi:MAG: acyl-CoA/acyl-ACP dehydrogenase [Deltaproteobacteria bacterium]|nr:acyl-CoA/acyl-ACP dehydrogenase [Deltaproteobacteria bacterium]